METTTKPAAEKAHSPANDSYPSPLFRSLDDEFSPNAFIVTCNFCGCEFDHADTAHTNTFVQEMCGLCVHRYQNGGRS